MFAVEIARQQLPVADRALGHVAVLVVEAADVDPAVVAARRLDRRSVEVWSFAPVLLVAVRNRARCRDAADAGEHFAVAAAADGHQLILFLNRATFEWVAASCDGEFQLDVAPIARSLSMCTDGVGARSGRPCERRHFR